MFPKRLFILVCCTLGGCLAPQHAFVTEVDPAGWSSQDEVTVRFENIDTLSLRNLNLVVRYGNNFLYDRLNLSVTTITPAGFRWCDTVSIPLSDRQLDLQSDHNHLYRRRMKLPERGSYLFQFRPVKMPQDTIRGIWAVGVDIQ
ncbi:MAG: hypothetical protein PHV49_06335 [Alistipes sp.]|nr:hypothetical protein [Alistipes sp.]